MQETWVPSLGQEGPLEKDLATHSGMLAYEIPWTEEPGGLQSMGPQRVGHNLVTKQQQQSLDLGPSWIIQNDVFLSQEPYLNYIFRDFPK